MPPVDRIEGRDIYSTQGWIARKGEEIHETVRDAGAAACVDDAILRTSIVLPNEDSARLGAFLLSAAKVDIIDAAQKACAAWRNDASIHDVRQAMKALAAELAKLERGA
jgi:hypothetical protein